MADLKLTPPQAAPKWDHSAEDILKLTKEAIQKDRETLDKIAKLPKDECNFETVSHLGLHTPSMTVLTNIVWSLLGICKCFVAQ